MHRTVRPAGRLVLHQARTHTSRAPISSSAAVSPRAVRIGPAALAQHQLPQARHASSQPSEPLRQTALHDFHKSHGATMVPFGGFSMPVQYEGQGVAASHKWTREKASLFDVGHMVQHSFKGAGAQVLLEKMTPSALSPLGENRSTLSCLLHETGGIVDDTVITRLGPEEFYVVTNAGCREKDLAFIEAQIAGLPADARGALDWQVLDGHGLVALQGPLAAQILGECLARSVGTHLDLAKLYFGQCARASLHFSRDGRVTPPVLVSRGGYTGEDGFEISVPPEATLAVAQGLLDAAGPDRLRPAGLGARDSLRLEAGMCLYGHDLDDATTPVEAGLAWVIGKERRERGGFNGADTVLRQLKPKKEGGGVARRRVGLLVEGAPAREGAKLVDAQTEQEVGVVTSGVPSPTLGKNIAMGYVKTGYNKAGTKLGAVVRGKVRAAEVVKMPFVPSKFHREG